MGDCEKTKQNKKNKKKTVLICDQGLRLEFWGFSRLISLVSNLEMSKISVSLKVQSLYVIDIKTQLNCLEYIIQSDYSPIFLPHNHSVAMPYKTDKDCPVSICDMVISFC